LDHGHNEFNIEYKYADALKKVSKTDFINFVQYVFKVAPHVKFSLLKDKKNNEKIMMAKLK